MTQPRPDDERAVLLRIVVLNPVAGCAYALQRGKAELDQIQVSDGADLVFNLSVSLRPLADGLFDPKGTHVQEPRGARFVYINSGTLVGQAGSCWTRRAKVPLRGVDSELPGDGLNHMPPVIEARIAGKARDGGPACASVPLLGDGWHRLIG